MTSRLSRALLALLVTLPAAVPSALAKKDPPPPMACPALPEVSGLHWETRDQGQFLLCRALDASDHQAFGIMLTEDKPDIRLSKRNRAEAGAINGEEMYWYYPDAAGNTLESRRITVVEIGNDRYAQIWIEAGDEQSMASLQRVVSGLALQ